MLDYNDPLAKSCARCGHTKLKHGKGEKPCQAYSCKRDKRCDRFVTDHSSHSSTHY